MTKLSIDEFSASMGLPMTPKVRFLKQKLKGKKTSEKAVLEIETSDKEVASVKAKEELLADDNEEEENRDLLQDAEQEGKTSIIEDAMYAFSMILFS